MPTFTSNARAQKPATGEFLATWGEEANSAVFDVFDKSLGFSTLTMPDANTTFTIPDGNAVPTDDPRGIALDIVSSGSLTQDRTITLAPNSVAKMWVIRNSTTGGFNILISQGSGGNVTIAPGFTAIVVSDGAGGGAAVSNLMENLEVTSLTGTIATAAQGTIDHATLNGGTPLPNLHVDHTAVSVITGAVSGLSGGQDIATSVTLLVDLNRLTDTAEALVDADELAFYNLSETASEKIAWLEVKDSIDWGTRVAAVASDSGIVVTELSTPKRVTIKFDANQLANEPDGSLVTELVVRASSANSRRVAIGLVSLSQFADDLSYPTYVGSVSISVSSQSIGGNGDAGAVKEFIGVVSGALQGDYCVLGLPASISKDLSYMGRIDGGNFARLTITNSEDSGSSITGGTYKIMVLRP